MIFNHMRDKLGKVLLVVIVVLIGFVFAVQGVFNRSRYSGMHGGAVAGSVNGEPISLREFSQEYERRMEFYKNMFGGKINAEQMKQFRLREGVFQEMVQRKLMVQEARRQGLAPSDEEVREKIAEIAAFRKDGRFDRIQYKQILQANGYTVATFEQRMRDDLAAAKWGEYFRMRTFFSDDELKKEYQFQNSKREIKYVLLNADVGAKLVNVSSAEVDAFLKQEAKVNLAKQLFEAKKQVDYKGKDFDQVKADLAKQLIAREKSEEVRKANENLAQRITPLLGAGNEVGVNGVLKPYGATVKTTGLIARKVPSVPGLGNVPELMRDAFDKSQPIKGKAKVYVSGPNIAIATVVKTEEPNMANFEKERDKIVQQVRFKKERSLFEVWMEQVAARAKVKRNEAIISGEG